MPNILIVDDDPDYVEITRDILEAKGYKVNSVSNSQEAVAIMKKERPDLILLDIMMTDILDGLKVTEKMRDDPNLYRVPIIVVSSIAESPFAENFPTDEHIHIDDWVSKPVQPDVLLEKIKLYLQRSKS